MQRVVQMRRNGEPVLAKSALTRIKAEANALLCTYRTTKRFLSLSLPIEAHAELIVFPIYSLTMRFQSILALIAFTSTSLVLAVPVAAPVAVAEAVPEAAPLPAPEPAPEPEAKPDPGYTAYGS
jgi:hypothetical protein